MTKDHNVIDFGGVTRLDLDPNRILDNAPRTLQSVFIMGWDEDGEIYFASSSADGGDLMWLMENAKYRLMEMCDD
jgi:hypothetical protein